MAQNSCLCSHKPIGAVLSLAIAVLFLQIVAQTSANAAPVCVQPPASLVSWWAGDGNADDIWGGNNGALENGVTFVAGEVGQAFHFASASTQFVQTSNASNLSFERTDAFSIDAWVRTTETVHDMFVASKQPNSIPFDGYGLAITNGEKPACDASNSPAAGAGQLSAFIDGAVSSTCPPDFYIAVRGTSHLNDGNWHHVAMTYDGSSTAAGVKLYVDGVEETEVTMEDTLGTHSIANSVPFDIGSRDGGGVPFNGDVDEVEVSDSELSGSEVQAIFNAGTAGKCKPAAMCTAPPTGLVSWYPGDGNANDIWTGNNGTTQNGVTFEQGLVSQAFHFNAADTQFVQVPNVNDLSFERTNPFTIDTWLRTTETAVNEFIATKRLGTSPETGYGLLVNNGQAPKCFAGDATPPGAGDLTFFLDNSDNANCPRDHAVVVNGATKVNDGQWHHVAVTYDGSTSAAGVKIYIDGVLDTLTTLADDLAATTITNGSPFIIGADSASGIQPFDGDMDEFEVFNRALSQTEIQNIVNARTLGKCKLESVAGTLKISPSKLNFGTVAVGQSRTKILKVTNAGHVSKTSHPVPITVKTQTEAGMPSPDPFSVTMQCFDDSLVPRAKGVKANICQVGVKFMPSQKVAYSGMLTIFDNLSGSGMQAIPIAGKGK